MRYSLCKIKRVEPADSCQRGGGFEGWVGEKVKGLSSINWYLQRCHRDVDYSIGNLVNNVMIHMYGAR